MAPYGEVLRLSLSRDPWQQDLIRRLHSLPDYNQDDFQETLTMLKAHVGLVPSDEAPVPEPLSVNNIPFIAPDPPQVLLNSLENLCHVNRLAENETLRFGTDGITVIYGDNGSGKSGYCRVLKKTCRVRAGADDRILGNVFDQELHHPAEATICFSVAGEDREVLWIDGTGPPEELSLISVFDTRVAPLYVDAENRIEYLPRGLDILPRLGEICRRLGTAIQTEIEAIQRRLVTVIPTFPEGTRIAAAVAKLSTSTPFLQIPGSDEIANLGAWNAEDDQRLADVIEALESSPEVSATKCRDLRGVIENLIKDCALIENTLGDRATTDIDQMHQQMVTAMAAAQLAAVEAFMDDPLPGIGSSAWKLMFEYAKEFSTTAYPDEHFPVVGEGRRCLLCMQLLSQEASARLIRFQQFVQDRAQSEARRLQNAIKDSTRQIRNLSIRDPRDSEALLVGASDFVETASIAITAFSHFLESSSIRKDIIISALNGTVHFDAIPVYEPSPTPHLMELAGLLLGKEQSFEALRDPERRRLLVNQESELLAKKKLSENLQNVLQRADDLRELAQLKLCKSACDTTLISRRNSEMRSMFFTEDFRRKLRQELEAFGLSHMDFRVDERSAGGANLIGVRVDTPIDVQNKDVLSDGEYRALALACFFAEVSGINDHSPIVFDDPVSSLDHVRTRHVAERLVDAAANGRQVIIFTHDLAFYYELWSLAAEMQVPLARHWLRYTEERGFGTVGENEEPWEVKKVGQRLQHLQLKLTAIRGIQERGEKYRSIAKDFYTDLRDTWERLVEEMLLNQVVNRFQPGIRTQSLKGVVVEDEDYKRIFFGMKKASECSGHDRAQRRQVAPPEPDEMAQDLTEIGEYIRTLRDRRNTLQPLREALEVPPIANFGQ